MIVVASDNGPLRDALKQVLNADYPERHDFDPLAFAKMREYLLGKSVRTIVFFADEKPAGAFSEGTLLTNIVGAANAVRVAEHFRARFVYLSTAAVFPGTDGNYREDSPVMPLNRWAWSKLAGEAAARMYDRSLVVRGDFLDLPYTAPYASPSHYSSVTSLADFAAKFAKAITSEVVGTLHIGREKTDQYTFATDVSPEKKILSKTGIRNLPKDISLNVEAYKVFFE